MYTIYGKEKCPFCDKAKALLDSKELRYEYKELDKDYTKEDLLRMVPNARTMPQIFKGLQYVGGFEDLDKSLKACLI